VDQEQVGDIVEQRDAPEDHDAIRQPPARVLECREQQQRRADRHRQIEQ
jgi:hypothetical protein